MAWRFTIAERKKQLLEGEIDGLVRRSHPEVWQESRENKSMGNGGCSRMQSIIYAWIVGLWDDPRLQTPLDDAATHLKEAIDKGMVIDYVSRTGNRPHPEHEAMEHNQCAIIAVWLKGDPAPIPEFARQDMEWYKLYIECDYDWRGEPATPGQRRIDCGKYLLDCISAGDFAEAVRYFETLAAPVDGKKPPMPRLARMAYHICQARLADEPVDEKLVMEGEKLLGKNLKEPWLNHGGSMEAARWIKAVYWDTGTVTSPQEAFDRARVILEKDEPVTS